MRVHEFILHIYSVFYKETHFSPFSKSFHFQEKSSWTSVCEAVLSRVAGLHNSRGQHSLCLLYKWFPWRKPPGDLARQQYLDRLIAQMFFNKVQESSCS